MLQPCLAPRHAESTRVQPLPHPREFYDGKLRVKGRSELYHDWQCCGLLRSKVERYTVHGGVHRVHQSWVCDAGDVSSNWDLHASVIQLGAVTHFNGSVSHTELVGKSNRPDAERCRRQSVGGDWAAVDNGFADFQRGDEVGTGDWAGERNVLG